MEQGVKSKPGRPPRGVASSFSSPSPAVTVEREREASVRRSSPRVAGAFAGETPPLPLGKPRGRAISKLHDSEPAQKPKMEQSSGRGKRKFSTAPSPLGNVGERQEPKEAKEEQPQGQGKSKLSEPKTPRSSYRTPARRRRPAEPEDEVAVKVAEKEQVSGDINEDEVEGGDKDSNATEEEAEEEEEEEGNKEEDGQGEEEEETDDDGDEEGPKLDEGFYEVEEIQGKRMRKVYKERLF